MTTLPMNELDPEHLKMGLALSGVGIFIFDPKKQEIRWDNRMYQLFGFSTEKYSATCEDFQNLIFPADREEVTAFFTNMSITNPSNEVEFRLLPTPSVPIRYINMKAKVAKIKDEQIEEIIGICADITVFKMTKDEADNPTKELFLENMSHELRTPLTAILGFTGTLLMKLPGPINEAQEKQLNTIKSNTKRIIALIDNFDLFDATKVESGNVPVVLEKKSISDLLFDISQTLAPILQTKGFDFDIDLNTKFYVKADTRIFKQIILNLVNFILRYSKANKIRIFATANDAVTVNITYNNSNPESNLGLGLHLSKQLGKLMNSTISHSHLNGESTLCVTLPKAEEDSSGETRKGSTEKTMV